MKFSAAFVSLAILLLAGPGQGAHRVTIQRQTFRGKDAAANFNVSQSITCVDQSEGTVTLGGFLDGSEQISKDTGTPKTVGNGVFVEIFNYSNSCTGASMGFGTGGILNGLTPPDKRLNSAGISGTTSVQDVDTGREFSATFDLVLEGTGPLSVVKANTKTKTVHPFVITIVRSASSNRSAVVSGTFTFDRVVLSPVFDLGTLSANGNATITIEK